MNEKSVRRFLSLPVLLTAISICAFCLILFFCLQKKDASFGRAEIYLSGELVKVVDLADTEDLTFEVKEGVVLQIENHEIFFAASPCANHRCVQCGKISHPGESVLCLPMGVLVQITDDAVPAVDAII